MVQPQEREKNHLDFATLRVSHCEPNDMTQTYLNTFYDLEINSVIGITFLNSLLLKWFSTLGKVLPDLCSKKSFVNFECLQNSF